MYAGKWSELAGRSVRFSPEARKTWTTVTVEYAKGVVTARVGKAPALEVKQPDLVVRGSFGLYAWGGKQAGSAQFRNYTEGDR